jgi:hypothetical protein
MGQCSPKQLLYLATGMTDAPTGFAASDSFVYWSSGTSVSRISVSGGSVQTFASAQAGPQSVTVDGSNVYWADKLGGAIMTAPESGGSPSVFAAATTPTFVSITPTNVTWVEADNIIKSMPKTGGSAVTLCSIVPYKVIALSSNAAHAYFVLARLTWKGCLDCTDALGRRRIC